MAEREQPDAESVESLEPAESTSTGTVNHANGVFVAEAPDDDAPIRAPRQGSARRAALLGLRLANGVIGVAAATAIAAAVGLVPLPALGFAPPGVEVVPAPADQVRACAGAVLRLGDETGANADVPQAIGSPSVASSSLVAELDAGRIEVSDAGTDGGPAAPRVLTVSPEDGAAVAGAQSQRVDAADYVGFAAAACTEPSSSVWLAGGATTVGRTTLLTLVNPTAVAATVKLTILDVEGAVIAPGMNGIDVPAGSQRVLSVAGFAPDLASPIIHVEARGGQVVAYLQQSIVRGLDSVGVDLVNGSPGPAASLTIPGVRVVDSVGVNRSLALADWEDAAPAIRLVAPGDVDATATVSVIPADPELDGTSFEVDLTAGRVTELPLDSGAETDTDGVALADGLYTVTVESDQPVVAGVRVTTAVDPGEPDETGDGATPEAPESDVAWYAPAPALTEDTLLTVAAGPDPLVAVANSGDVEVTLLLEGQGVDDITLVIPARSTASAAVEEGAAYLLRDPVGLHVAVSYADETRLASYPLTSARPTSGPITIRP